MKKYVLKRLLEMIPTTVGVLVLTFILFHVVGGSPAEVVLGKNATADALAAFDARFGYDKPLLFGRWAPIRALGVAVEKRPSDEMTALPLLYTLHAGTYRLRASAAEIAVVDEKNVQTTRAVHRVKKDLQFTVLPGEKVVWLHARGASSNRLEKQNQTWYDSQFINYMVALLQGDFGLSVEASRPVTHILRGGVIPSLVLTVPILVGGTVIGLMLSLICAAWRGGFTDRSILVLSTVLMSVNYVVWVLAGQFILAFKLRLFPIWGFEHWTYLLLPVIIGIVSGLGRDIRFFRAVILDEVYKPYVRTAQAKGLSGATIMLRHVMRNSLIPVVTYVSLSIPFLFTGSLLLESFFGIPGLGNVSLNAINSSDMAVVRAVVIVGALLYQGVNLITDVCYAYLDPRVRVG